MRIPVNESIHLSPIKLSDKSACVQLLDDRDIFDVTLRIPHPYTESDFEKWYALIDTFTQENGQPAHWAIRGADGRLIGAVGFRDFKIGASHQAEIGYWLGQPFWGHGIMTQVVTAACAFAFREWNLVKISAEVFASNLASARVLQKCGFTQEGLLRKHFAKDGKFLDVRLYGLLQG